MSPRGLEKMSKSGGKPCIEKIIGLNLSQFLHSFRFPGWGIPERGTSLNVPVEDAPQFYRGEVPQSPHITRHCSLKNHSLPCPFWIFLFI